MKFIYLVILLPLAMSSSIQLEKYQEEWLSHFYAPKMYGMYQQGNSYKKIALEGILEPKLYTCIPNDKGPACIDRIQKEAMDWYLDATWKKQVRTRRGMREDVINFGGMNPNDAVDGYLVNWNVLNTNDKWTLLWSYADIYKCDHYFRETLTSIFTSRRKFEAVVSTYKDKSSCYSGQLNNDEYNTLMAQLTNLHRQLYGATRPGGSWGSSSSDIKAEIEDLKKRLAKYKERTDAFIKDIGEKESALKAKQDEDATTINQLSTARNDLEILKSNIKISIACASDAATTYYDLSKCHSTIERDIKAKQTLVEEKKKEKARIEEEISQMEAKIKEKQKEKQENEALRTKALETMNTCQSKTDEYSTQQKTTEKNISDYLKTHETNEIDINKKKEDLMKVKTAYQKLLVDVAMYNMKLQWLEKSQGGSDWGSSSGSQVDVHAIRKRIDEYMIRLENLISNCDFTTCPPKTNKFLLAVAEWELSVSETITHFESFKKRTQLLTIKQLKEQYINDFKSKDVVSIINRVGAIPEKSFVEPYYNELTKIWTSFPFSLAQTEQTTRRLLRMLKRK